MKKEH